MARYYCTFIQERDFLGNWNTIKTLDNEGELSPFYLDSWIDKYFEDNHTKVSIKDVKEFNESSDLWQETSGELEFTVLELKDILKEIEKTDRELKTMELQLLNMNLGILGVSRENRIGWREDIQDKEYAIEGVRDARDRFLKICNYVNVIKDIFHIFNDDVRIIYYID